MFSVLSRLHTADRMKKGHRGSWWTGVELQHVWSSLWCVQGLLSKVLNQEYANIWDIHCPSTQKLFLITKKC